MPEPLQFRDARELFRAASEASRDAERCRRQLAAMEARALSLGGGLGGGVRATGEPDRMAGRVAAMADREAALRRRVDWDYAVIDLACAVLYGADSDAGLWALVGWRADALALHYLDGMTWAEVGRRLGYSEQHVWREAQVALDLCDGWGVAAAMAGRGGAEG